LHGVDERRDPVLDEGAHFPIVKIRRPEGGLPAQGGP
jgi:hypothetical protein